MLSRLFGFFWSHVKKKSAMLNLPLSLQMQHTLLMFVTSNTRRIWRRMSLESGSTPGSQKIFTNEDGSKTIEKCCEGATGSNVVFCSACIVHTLPTLISNYWFVFYQVNLVVVWVCACEAYHSCFRLHDGVSTRNSVDVSCVWKHVVMYRQKCWCMVHGVMHDVIMCLHVGMCVCTCTSLWWVQEWMHDAKHIMHSA